MADVVKEATIVLKLDAKEYARGLAGLEKPAGEAGAKSGSAFSTAFASGLKGAKGAVEGLLSTIKTGALAFSGIAGMAGTMDLARHALAAEGTYKKLAFQIQAGTGQLVNFRGMMDKAKDAATTWGKDVDQLGGAMSRMFEETGKADVATANIDTVAMVARASREPVESLGAAAGMLSKKFKIANGDMADSLGVLLSAANKGGLTFDELSGRLGYVGAIAKEAGLEGKEGLAKIVGMLNVGEESSKNLRKALGTVSSIVEEFGKKAPRDKLLMQLGISPSSVKGGIDDALKAVIAKTGGSKEKLQVAFKNEAQVEFLVDMGKSYAKAYAETAGSVKTKSKAAMDALDEAMKHAAKTHMDEASLREIANKNMQSGQARMDVAIEKMKAAFMREEVTSAIAKLADVLPILADRTVAAVDLFAKHPILSGGAILGGQALKGAAGSALPGLLKGAFAEGAALLGFAGKSVGGAAGAAVGQGMVAAAPAAGQGIGGAIAPIAGPAMGNILVVAGLAAAASVAAAVSTYKGLDEKYKGKGMQAWWMNAKHNLGITSDEEYWRQRSEMGGEANPYASLGGWEQHVKGKPGESVDAAERAMARKAARAANEAAGYEVMEVPPGEEDLGQVGPRMSNVVKGWRPPAAAPGQSKEDAALFAEMMAAKVLKVQIDAAQISALQQAMSGGGSGGPAPGYADRP